MTLRAVTIALALSGLVASARQSSVPVSRTLLPNAPVQQSLGGGERITFTFSVPANTAAHVTVAQEGVDVRSVLRRTASATPAHSLDFVAGSAGVEHLYPLVTDAPASWDVVISSSLPRAERGDYTITLDLATADDRSRARAEARDLHYRTLAPNAVEDGTFISAQAAGYAAAASAAQAAGDLEQTAESTFQTARRYDNLGDLAAAREWHTRALALFQQLGRPDREGRVLTRLGDVARKTGDVADAERYFRDALPRSREAGDAVMLADIMNNSGLLLLSIGRYDEAIDQLQGALPTARAIGSADVEGAMTHNLAQAYGNLGDYDRAVEFFLKSIEVKKVLRLPRRIATSTLALSEVYFNMGDRARAEETVASAVALFDQAGDRVGKADARGQQALMMHAAGDSARALEQFAQVVPELHAVQSRVGEARILEAWAEAEVDRGDAAAALPKAEEAVRLARLAASPSREARALYVKAKALRANRPADAIESIGAAITIVESTRAGLQRTELRTSYLATVRRYFDLAIDLLHQQGKTAEAFEMSERARARARALLEGLAQSEARIEKGVDAQLTAKRRAVQSQINAKAAYRAQVAGQDGEASAAATSATREIAGLLQQLADVESAIRAASPSYWALQKTEPIDVARVQQQLLDARTALVEYHVGHERSLVWVVDRESVTAHVLPGSEALDDLARRYHQALSGDPASLSVSARDTRAAEVAAVGRRLTAAVWTPIASRVRGKRVLIVADGALQYVPFAALPAAGGTPLIARHEIVYLPSASVLETMRRESRPVRATAIAIFADPVFSKSDPRLAAARDAAAPAQSRAGDGGVYGRLRFSRREAEAIAAILPGAFQALDFSAAKSTVLSRSLRDYRILHFATHGTLNTQHPQLSGLVLSLIDRGGKPVDGYLRLHEIYNLDLDADLVVLSACRTALGKEVHGEGLIGLTRGFMFAGASRVVSSVWNVDDRASAELMKRFYEAMLTRKLSPSAALRQAQLSLLAEPRWANPHYWAAFGAFGEPN